MKRNTLSDAQAVKKRLLFLSKNSSDELKKFVVRANDASENVSITHALYDDLIIEFCGENASITLRSTGENIASYDGIHCKSSTIRDLKGMIARYADRHNRVMIDGKMVREFIAGSKLYQYDMLTAAGISIPRSIFMTPQTYVQEGSYETIADTLGVPFVLKDIHTSRGRNNEVIRTLKDYEKMTQRVLGSEVYLIAQEFIPNDGDYRILVLGDAIELAIWRRRKDDSTHLNNTSQGSIAELHDSADLPLEVQRDALNAKRALKSDIAGVDMVRDNETGKWYCFEVNFGPQMATSAFAEDKLQAYARFINHKLEAQP